MNDKEDRESEEVEVELSNRNINLLNRLMREGYYTSRSQAAQDAVTGLKTGDTDPRVEERINQLRDIGDYANQNAEAKFFADTTELMNIYVRAAEGSPVELAEDMNAVYEILEDRVLKVSERNSQDLDQLVEGVFSIAEDLQNELDGDNVDSAKVNDYLETYDRDTVKTIL